MKIINWLNLDPQSQAKVLQRPATSSSEQFRQDVSQIISAVRIHGDKALVEFNAKFDHVTLSEFKVQEVEFQQAEAHISRNVSQAIDQAIHNVTKFHDIQTPTVKSIATMPGVSCQRETRPIEKVGLYVPSGTAPLLSTVIMLAIPAKIAGCQTKVLCTPPQRDGSIDPHILTTARRCGIDQIYKVGGAQAIAAMAYGTETVPKVYKIFGPGNAWVTEAKLQVAMDPSGALYDMPAGPSEVLVIGDETSHPPFIAADLLSQAEHGVDSQSLLVTDSPSLAQQVVDCLEKQMETLTRQSIVRQSLEHSSIILCANMDEAMSISNQYGPEHLILQCQGAQKMIHNISNAGSVFVGPWTPESVGDYASGTNHVLPTYGYAKSTSGLGVDAFVKQITVQTLSPEGLKNLGPTVMDLAEVEGLDAHREAVRIRLATLSKEES